MKLRLNLLWASIVVFLVVCVLVDNVWAAEDNWLGLEDDGELHPNQRYRERMTSFREQPRIDISDDYGIDEDNYSPSVPLSNDDASLHDRLSLFVRDRSTELELAERDLKEERERDQLVSEELKYRQDKLAEEQRYLQALDQCMESVIMTGDSHRFQAAKISSNATGNSGADASAPVNPQQIDHIEINSPPSTPHYSSGDSGLGLKHFRLLSLNINSGDTEDAAERIRALVDLFMSSEADVIALQEVEDWVYTYLKDRTNVFTTYHHTDFGSQHAPGGLLILSKHKIYRTAFYEKTEPGQVEIEQRGKMLVAYLALGQNQNVSIGSAYMDWRSSQSRANSLDFIFDVVHREHDVFIAGDFNFDTDAKPESDHIPRDCRDLWSILRPNEEGYTWNPHKNYNAKRLDAESQPSRVDRIFSRVSFCHPSTIELVANQPLSESAREFPSGHFGLLFTCTIV